MRVRASRVRQTPLRDRVKYETNASPREFIRVRGGRRLTRHVAHVFGGGGGDGGDDGGGGGDASGRGATT